MKIKLFTFLRFIRILDEHEHRLSMTNIALIVVVVKIAFVGNASVADLGALFTGLLAYSYKKTIPRQVVTTSQEITQVKATLDQLTTKIESVESKASQLAVAAGFKKMS